jgi:hypothetical protein
MCREAIRRATISAIESGRVTRPHPRTMRVISKALGVEAWQIREFAALMGGASGRA